MQHNSKPVPIKNKRVIPSDTYRDGSESHSKARKQKRINKRSQYTK